MIIMEGTQTAGLVQSEDEEAPDAMQNGDRYFSLEMPVGFFSVYQRGPTTDVHFRFLMSMQVGHDRMILEGPMIVHESEFYGGLHCERAIVLRASLPDLLSHPEMPEDLRSALSAYATA